MPLVYLSVAWLAGIALASLLRPPGALLALAAILPLAVLFLWRADRRARLLAGCGLLLLLGAGRYLLALPHFDAGDLAAYNGQGRVTVQGAVVGEPDVRGSYTNLRLRVDNLLLENASHTVEGVALVRVSRYPEYRYGDRLQVAGLLETPPEREDFSYKDYLARQGVYSLVRQASVTLLSRNGGSPFWRAVYAFKARARRTIADILHEPPASLLTGILLGVETGIPSDVMADFSATGTTHIIVISGFNFAIVAGLLSALGERFVGRTRSFYFALTGIVLYMLLVGVSGAVVRAAVMGVLYAWGVHLGRRSDALNSTLAAAFLMTLWNPHWLWDLGFQLSFAATLGLVLFTDPLQRRFRRLLARLLPRVWVRPVSSFLNDALVVTTAAQITTLPIILYNFRQLSLVTLLTNLLILPAQPAVMLWGGVATVAGLLWLPLGRVLGWVAWLFLTYTIGVVKLTAAVPYASIGLGRVSAGAVWAYYGLLLAGVWVMTQDGKKRQAWWARLTGHLPTKVVVGGLSLLLLLVWVAIGSLPDGKLHVVFFDVGQGDAVFIQSPTGQQVLVDGGPDPTALLARLGGQMPFWDRSLDLVILTHPDADHLTGLVPVLERYRVAQVFDAAPPADTPTCDRWRELLAQKNVPVLDSRAGTQVVLEGGVTLTVLHPGSAPLADVAGAGSNNHSIVTRLVMGQVSVLLPGDIETRVESELLRSGQPLVSTVLKAPHHGSDTSSSPAFLEAVSPQVAIVSVGQDNRFGHPSPEVLARLAAYTVLRTDERGSIEVITDGQWLWIKTQR
jgi:competence protein ComEC